MFYNNGYRLTLNVKKIIWFTLRVNKGHISAYCKILEI